MRGGAREGAGRKPVAEAERRVSKTVRLPFGLIAEIQARADAEDVSFTTWLEDAAMEALRRAGSRARPDTARGCCRELIEMRAGLRDPETGELRKELGR